MKKLSQFPIGTLVKFYSTAQTYCLLSYKAEQKYFNVAFISSLNEYIVAPDCFLWDYHQEGLSFEVVGYTKIITI